MFLVEGLQLIIAVLLMVLGSFALIASAVCALVFAPRTTLAMLMSAFAAAGAVCLLYATTALRRKKDFSGVALLVPVCAMVLTLILFYREHAADPILRHYYVETLALAALTVLLLEFAAFAFRGGAPRVLVPMHYRFGAHGYPEIGTLDEFLALYEAKKIHKLDGNSFELTKNAPAGVIVPRFAE